MDTPIRTRQELYDMIRQTSKEAFILSEMTRLGFWAEEEGKPTVAKEIIQRETKLRKELNDLLQKQSKYRNQDKLLKEMREKRMADSKKRREENKKKREEDKIARAKAWAEKQKTDIIYLGKGVSAGLHNKEGNPSKLEEYNLPNFADVKTLAEAMKITIGKLRFLTFTRKTSRTTHYRRFHIPKKTGGHRTISAPMPKLKEAQYWVLDQILYKKRVHDLAHGFVPERSIKTNAAPHVGQDVVINMDLRNFFPTITYKRVKGMFRALGYSEQIATILGLLCTEPEVDEVKLDGETFYVAKGERYLPQGAPTSPAITNILCDRMDKRLTGIAKKFGYNYTRYADDLTFSASGDGVKEVGKILWCVQQVVENEGFVLHPDKLKVMRNGSRKEVTGIVVNEKLNTDRKTLRKFRALLYQIEKQGIKGKKWGNGYIANTIRGYANFIHQVNPEKGLPYVNRVKAILADPNIQLQLQEEAIEKATKARQPKEEEIVIEVPTAEELEATQPKNEAEEKPWWDVF